MREYPGAPAGGQDLRGDVVPRSRSGFGSAPFSGAGAAVLEILAADRHAITTVTQELLELLSVAAHTPTPSPGTKMAAASAHPQRR